jgi:hypothetical protein
MSQAILCSAIHARKLITFYYDGDDIPGFRTVEPYMVAHDSSDNLVLIAWFLGEISESTEGQGWREYFLSNITDVLGLAQEFSAIRHGYDPSGKKFQNIECAV